MHYKAGRVGRSPRRSEAWRPDAAGRPGRTVASPHFSPGAVMIAEDFGPVYTRAQKPREGTASAVCNRHGRRTYGIVSTDWQVSDFACRAGSADVELAAARIAEVVEAASRAFAEDGGSRQTVNGLEYGRNSDGGNRGETGPGGARRRATRAGVGTRGGGLRSGRAARRRAFLRGDRRRAENQRGSADQRRRLHGDLDGADGGSVAGHDLLH